MIIYDGQKYACLNCIRGHRSTSCGHKDRVLLQVRRRGRLATGNTLRYAIVSRDCEDNTCEGGNKKGGETSSSGNKIVRVKSAVSVEPDAIPDLEKFEKDSDDNEVYTTDKFYFIPVGNGLYRKEARQQLPKSRKNSEFEPAGVRGINLETSDSTGEYTPPPPQLLQQSAPSQQPIQAYSYSPNTFDNHQTPQDLLITDPSLVSMLGSDQSSYQQPHEQLAAETKHVAHATPSCHSSSGSPHPGNHSHSIHNGSNTHGGHCSHHANSTPAEHSHTHAHGHHDQSTAPVSANGTSHCHSRNNGHSHSHGHSAHGPDPRRRDGQAPHVIGPMNFHGNMFDDLGLTVEEAHELWPGMSNDEIAFAPQCVMPGQCACGEGCSCADCYEHSRKRRLAEMNLAQPQL